MTRLADLPTRGPTPCPQERAEALADLLAASPPLRKYAGRVARWVRDGMEGRRPDPPKGDPDTLTIVDEYLGVLLGAGHREPKPNPRPDGEDVRRGDLNYPGVGKPSDL